MARNRAGLERALQEIPPLREEFWKNVNVPGSGETLNRSLEQAGRVADFLELGELFCRDALSREESCGCHFREEYQYPDGECKRDDERFAHVAAWEYQGEGKAPLRNVEPLAYEFTKMSVGTASERVQRGFRKHDQEHLRHRAGLAPGRSGRARALRRLPGPQPEPEHVASRVERWWGGYHLMNEAEIHWIVEQIFVGNLLSRGEAKIEHGDRLDIKAIRSPIIVFPRSKGDNITPPQQALNWIADTFPR